MIETAQTIHVLTVERETHEDCMNPSVQSDIRQPLLLSTCSPNPHLSHHPIPINATVAKNLTHWLIIGRHITHWLLPLSWHLCDQFRYSLSKDDLNATALFFVEGFHQNWVKFNGIRSIVFNDMLGSKSIGLVIASRLHALPSTSASCLLELIWYCLLPDLLGWKR